MDRETFDLLLGTVRRFVEERLIPNEDRVEREEAIPAEIVKEMKELGLFGISIPEEYGGLGLTMVEEAAVIRELCRASLTYRSMLGTTVGIGSQGIIIDGTEAQKREWLPKLASGEMVSSFALTEPGSGSDAASITTRGVRDGDTYRITGTKRYITNAPRAGVFTLMARTEDKPGAGGISAFIVPAGTKGVSFGPVDRKMGQRGTITTDVILDDVVVPAENIIGGKPGKGFYTAMKVLDRGRIHMGAVATGMARRLVEESVRYAVERKQFGKSLGEFQLIQGLLADSRTELVACEAMVDRVAAILDRDGAAPLEAAAVKYFTTEAVGRIADRAVQIHGGAGYMAEYKVERFYRDVRLLRIYEGTSQIQQVIIARSMLREAGLDV